MDPSGYTLDTVQNRGEFLICRGHQRIHASSHPSPVLVFNAAIGGSAAREPPDAGT